MGDHSAIEWTRGDDGTAGATWNPIRGMGGRLLDGRTWDEFPEPAREPASA